ncbi:hypothetical protein A8144_06210 [Mycobacterium leprae 3125609]|nr:hypothetical protein A8144_06210 [Mycobacterium leprae 3125609]OAX71590.1 hypothetical protein A3216_04660 [Mycobacterium leprae 7935681]
MQTGRHRRRLSLSSAAFQGPCTLPTELIGYQAKLADCKHCQYSMAQLAHQRNSDVFDSERKLQHALYDASMEENL